MLEAREHLRKSGETVADLIGKLPIEVGLQTDKDYPIKGVLDYAAPTVDPSTGTLALRGIFQNPKRHCFCPAISSGCGCRCRTSRSAVLMVPEVALGSDQSGRYVFLVNGDNIVEQRKVTVGAKVEDMRVITSGLTADDRVVTTGLCAPFRARRSSRSWCSPRESQRDAIGLIARFFIDRPVLANVIAVLMVVVGAVALFNLPVAQYPDVVPPTVQVTTRYPGASARTVVDTVALPIEQQVNGVEDMLYMQSFSGSDGSYSLTVTFRIGVDLNFAQVLVQNRVASAASQLPQAVQSQGVTVQKKSTAILMFVTLTSPDARYDSLFLANYATIRLKDELARLPGVGNVSVFGAGQYSMRVWLDPEKLKARGLVPQDVIQSLQQQSQQVTAGQVGMPPVRARRHSNTRSTSPAGWTMPTSSRM